MFGKRKFKLEFKLTLEKEKLRKKKVEEERGGVALESHCS